MCSPQLADGLAPAPPASASTELAWSRGWPREMPWIERYQTGPLGGDAQIADQVLDRRCHRAIFFEDPHVRASTRRTSSCLSACYHDHRFGGMHHLARGSRALGPSRDSADKARLNPGLPAERATDSSSWRKPGAEKPAPTFCRLESGMQATRRAKKKPPLLAGVLGKILTRTYSRMV